MATLNYTPARVVINLMRPTPNEIQQVTAESAQPTDSNGSAASPSPFIKRSLLLFNHSLFPTFIQLGRGSNFLDDLRRDQIVPYSIRRRIKNVLIGIHEHLKTTSTEGASIEHWRLLDEYVTEIQPPAQSYLHLHPFIAPSSSVPSSSSTPSLPSASADRAGRRSHSRRNMVRRVRIHRDGQPVTILMPNYSDEINVEITTIECDDNERIEYTEEYDVNDDGYIHHRPTGDAFVDDDMLEAVSPSADDSHISDSPSTSSSLSTPHVLPDRSHWYEASRTGNMTHDRSSLPTVDGRRLHPSSVPHRRVWVNSSITSQVHYNVPNQRMNRANRRERDQP